MGSCRVLNANRPCPLITLIGTLPYADFYMNNCLECQHNLTNDDDRRMVKERAEWQALLAKKTELIEKFQTRIPVTATLTLGMQLNQTLLRLAELVKSEEAFKDKIAPSRVSKRVLLRWELTPVYKDEEEAKEKGDHYANDLCREG